MSGGDPYIKALHQALRANVDYFGEAIFNSGKEASYDEIKDLLRPLHLVGTIPGTHGWLTDSSVYYIPFGFYDSEIGGREFILTVADGSGLISNRFDSDVNMKVFVGKGGRERYGKELDRLSIGLASGYLPILQTEYQDDEGVCYKQESFATRIDETRSLVSFIKLTADRGSSQTTNIDVTFRLNPGHYRLDGNRVLSDVHDDFVHMMVSDGATCNGNDVVFQFDLSRGPQTVYALWLNVPSPAQSRAIDASGHEEAKEALSSYWDEILAQGAMIDVPDELVMHAKRNVLIQNLLLNNRYSIGNLYETVFNAEASDALQALGLYGFMDAYRAGLEQMVLGPNTANWERAMRLKHVAYYAMLSADFSLAKRHRVRLIGYAQDFRRQMDADEHGLLTKEPGGTDISDPKAMIYSLHFQTDAWRGLRDMALIWHEMGDDAWASQVKDQANSLRLAIRRVVDRCRVWMDDGSLFVPVRLLSPDESEPYDPITATTQGSYWLLVAPYAYASGFFAPGSDEARGILTYFHQHGAIFLGMLRFNYLGAPIGHGKEDGMAGMRSTGVDNAYLTSYVKFLSDNDEVDRLILSLYGKLAHGMTRGTFISGEGEELDVCGDPRCRSMYLPPNTANNASFLHALRLTLIKDEVDQDGRPSRLCLCPATPRAWLEQGKTIEVQDAPTLFGPLAMAVHSMIEQGRIEATIQLPERLQARGVVLRLRAPGQRLIQSVMINGQVHDRFDRDREEIDLSGASGTVTVTVLYELSGA